MSEMFLAFSPFGDESLMLVYGLFVSAQDGVASFNILQNYNKHFRIPTFLQFYTDLGKYFVSKRKASVCIVAVQMLSPFPKY